VQPERRPVAVALDPFALAGDACLEGEIEQPFPEALRAAQVVGGELDQVERDHPFSLCRQRPGAPVPSVTDEPFRSA